MIRYCDDCKYYSVSVSDPSCNTCLDVSGKPNYQHMDDLIKMPTNMEILELRIVELETTIHEMQKDYDIAMSDLKLQIDEALKKIQYLSYIRHNLKEDHPDMRKRQWTYTSGNVSIQKGSK